MGFDWPNSQHTGFPASALLACKAPLYTAACSHQHVANVFVRTVHAFVSTVQQVKPFLYVDAQAHRHNTGAGA